MKIKNIFKNNSKMSTENTEKEQIVDENTTENSINEVGSAATLTAEEQLQEELSNEKDKFLRLFAEFENYKKRTTKVQNC
jgi:molecular chaperone GrpE